MEKEKETPLISFEPTHFIRSHGNNMNSKNNNKDTQIWDVSFEPDVDKKKTKRVATCGGNSICIIDVNHGSVLMKYKHDDVNENFYALAWTTFEAGNGPQNFLVSGGTSGEIKLFSPEEKICSKTWKTVRAKEKEKDSVAINSLVFHSEKPNWLFCGTKDGKVSLWDIGNPTSPDFSDSAPTLLIRLFPDYGEVFRVAWTGRNNWLLASTASGLVGWKIKEDLIKSPDSNKPIMLDFILPTHKADRGDHPMVDSLAVASKWTIVCKCVLHETIYVWNLKSTLEKLIKKEEKLWSDPPENFVIEVDVDILASLKWSVRHFYLHLGCDRGNGLIACGGENGSLWVYHQPRLGKKGSIPTSEVFEPSAKLPWPLLEDNRHFKEEEEEVREIIINNVAVSGDTMVAVTSNNLVCIWKQQNV